MNLYEFQTNARTGARHGVWAHIRAESPDAAVRRLRELLDAEHGYCVYSNRDDPREDVFMYYDDEVGIADIISVKPLGPIPEAVLAAKGGAS